MNVLVAHAMTTKNSHLVLLGDERVPSDILDQFCCDIEAKSLDFRRHSLPSRGPQSSLDTLFFTAVAVFLFKSYFDGFLKDGFLKEAGRDHYVILKKALKRIWHKLFNRSDDFRVILLTSSGEVKPEYSFLFSIYAEINSGRCKWSASAFFAKGYAHITNSKQRKHPET